LWLILTRLQVESLYLSPNLRVVVSSVTSILWRTRKSYFSFIQFWISSHGCLQWAWVFLLNGSLGRDLGAGGRLRKLVTSLLSIALQLHCHYFLLWLVVWLCGLLAPMYFKVLCAGWWPLWAVWLPAVAQTCTLRAVLLLLAFAELYWSSVIDFNAVSQNLQQLAFRDKSVGLSLSLKWSWVLCLRPDLKVSHIELCSQFQFKPGLILSSGECLSTRILVLCLRQC
jgi:hypothetical protein